jgi:hypothetical protein
LGCNGDSCFGFVFDLLLDKGGTPFVGLPDAGAAYGTLGIPLSAGKLVLICGVGAGGAGRRGMIGDDTPPPGGRGAGRPGTRLPLD